MKIDRTNQNSFCNFGMNMKLGSNLKKAKLPSKISEQLEELKILLSSIEPFNKDAYIDFKKTKPSSFSNEYNFKYVIKPNEDNDVGAQYVKVGNFNSEENFFNQPFPKEVLAIHAQALYA